MRHKFFKKGDNPEKEVYKEFENQVLQEKGKVYDELPAKVELRPGRIYHWCSCGHGHSQVRNKSGSLLNRQVSLSVILWSWALPGKK